MTDHATFEARLTDAFARYVEQAPVAANAAAIAASVAAAPRRTLLWTPRRLLLVAILLLTAALAAAFGATGGRFPDLLLEIVPSPTKANVVPTPLAATPAVAPSTSLSKGRRGHTATLLVDGGVLVVGGETTLGGDPTGTVELYEPTTKTWTMAAPTLVVHAQHAATRLRDGTVLVVGGTVSAVSETYDPGRATWTAVGAMSALREYHTATLLQDGSVLVAGGRGTGIAPAELYDPATAKWQMTGQMIDTRYAHTATALPDGRVLVVGGYSTSGDGFGELATAELYVPAKGTWSQAAAAPWSFLGHTATLLQDGTVLVTGGWHGNNGQIEARAAVYDPTGDSWTTVPELLQARGGHTATLLSDGTVLVVGGASNGEVTCGNVLATAEIFDPVSRTWSASQSLLGGGRYSHVATSLLDGDVLITGGTDTGCMRDPLTSVELYVARDAVFR